MEDVKLLIAQTVYRAKVKSDAWDEEPEGTRNYYLNVAQAVLNALDAAGQRVQAKPTPKPTRKKKEEEPDEETEIDDPPEWVSRWDR